PDPLHADQGSLRRVEQHLRRTARRPGAGRRSAGLARRPHHPPPSERRKDVAFYVPLGPRGFILRIGTFLIGILGGAVYRVDGWRRGHAGAIPQPLTAPLPD